MTGSPTNKSPCPPIGQATGEPGDPPQSSRERFRRAARCQAVDRPPVWLMRQAGRALPEYRDLKTRYSFLQLVQTPELAVEVTLQPVRRFGFDAAILFSDILVIPEAMGQGYRFRDTGGIEMDFAVRTKADVDRLSVEAVCERLHYVETTLKLLRGELADRTALIGFCGSPWTLATFMMEGGSASQPARTLDLYRSDRSTFHVLLEKLTVAVSSYLKMQAACGVDALQIFDSHGGLLPPEDFQEASGRWMKEAVSEVRNQDPEGRVLETKDPGQNGPAVIVFSLGTHQSWPDLIGTRADVLGVDWQSSLASVRDVVPEGIALQGNLPPALLAEASPETVVVETRRVLDEMRGRNGHIFNLGHGTPPAARLENIGALMATVRESRS